MSYSILKAFFIDNPISQKIIEDQIRAINTFKNIVDNQLIGKSKIPQWKVDTLFREILKTLSNFKEVLGNLEDNSLLEYLSPLNSSLENYFAFKNNALKIEDIDEKTLLNNIIKLAKRKAPIIDTFKKYINSTHILPSNISEFADKSLSRQNTNKESLYAKIAKFDDNFSINWDFYRVEKYIVTYIQKLLSTGHFISAATKNDLNLSKLNTYLSRIYGGWKNGIVPCHAYSIIDCYKREDNNYYIQLVNPHQKSIAEYNNQNKLISKLSYPDGFNKPKYDDHYSNKYGAIKHKFLSKNLLYPDQKPEYNGTFELKVRDFFNYFYELAIAKDSRSISLINNIHNINTLYKDRNNFIKEFDGYSSRSKYITEFTTGVDEILHSANSTDQMLIKIKEHLLLTVKKLTSETYILKLLEKVNVYLKEKSY
ncbi:hypothetical protein [Francisella sp. SYW-9]|uniref:hypothetical protein n=1 Tax=Francisella sp. SYW-9 TaxID=2610888 RepID=UPI00123CF339|nr:hypothetical protein [Francisella sp. SYW-9]